MAEAKPKKTKKKVKHVALKMLFTSKGKVNKGEEFTCSDEELAIFKKVKAV